MEDFRRGGGKRFGGQRSGFGKRDDGNRGGFGGGRDRGQTTMHQAVCDQCHQPCEVPFRPTGDKPVYCNACFRNKRETSDDRGGNRFANKSRDSYQTTARTDFVSAVGGGNNNEIKKQLEALNVKMDRLIKVVEGMTKNKPLVVEEKVKEVIKAIPVVKAKKAVKKMSKK